MVDKVLVVGTDLVQYYIAKYLVNCGLAIFYEENKAFEKIMGAKTWQDKDELAKILANEEYVVVLPMFSDEKKYDFIDLTKVSCRLWEPGSEGQLDEILANLLVEAAIVELKLLWKRCIAGSGALLYGFNLYGERLAEKLSFWGATVWIVPVNETEYRLASYRGYNIYEGEKEQWNPDYVFVCSHHMQIDAKQMSRWEQEVILLNLTKEYQLVDMQYARKNQICAKHANHLLMEYAPEETGRLIAEQIAKQF